MTTQWLPLARAIFDAADDGALSTIPVRMRRLLNTRGLGGVPFGDGDAKTGVPSTYRRVGDTCPPTCPYLNGCYATVHHVGRAQRSASNDVDAAVATAMVCIVWAQKTGRPAARLHVSGDFGVDRDDSERYLNELRSALYALRFAAAERSYHWPATVAWTYTHHEGEWMESWRGWMVDAGLYIRRSDYFGPGGAVVWDFNDIVAARSKSSSPVAKCPAQLRDVNCADCRLCWERPDVTIAFNPHGATASRVRNAARNA